LQPWGKYNFVNPPFDQAARFFERAIQEANEGRVSVMLVPCRFHTRYFAAALPHVRRIYLIKPRVRFVGYRTPLQTAVCLLVFGSEEKLPVDPAVGEHVATAQPMNVGFYVDSGAPTVGDVLPEGAQVLHGALSGSLQALLASRQPVRVLCPTRLDNRTLQRALAEPTAHALFICPTLRAQRGDPHKFAEGSMLLSLWHDARGALSPGHTRTVPTVAIEPLHTMHNEETYSGLLHTRVTPT